MSSIGGGSALSVSGDIDTGTYAAGDFVPGENWTVFGCGLGESVFLDEDGLGEVVQSRERDLSRIRSEDIDRFRTRLTGEYGRLDRS